MNSSLLLLSEIRGRKRPREDLLPLQTTKKLLFVTVFVCLFLRKRNRRFARALFLFLFLFYHHTHTHTHTHTVLIARD